MTTTIIDFQHWASTQQQRIEAQLQEVLPNPDIAPQRLHQAMRYTVLGAGKRVRPLLAFAAGDALQSLAFQLLAEYRLADDPAVQLEMGKLLATAAGSRGMAGGQAIDLAAVGASLTLPELEFMHIHKTGALIRAATLLGARCGVTLEAAELAHLDRFAKYIGLAFQVVDDVLDTEA